MKPLSAAGVVLVGAFLACSGTGLREPRGSGEAREAAIYPVFDAHVHPAMRLVYGPGGDLTKGGGGGHFDSPRARSGGLRIAFAAALVGAWETGDPPEIVRRQLDALGDVVTNSGGAFVLATAPEQALSLSRSDRVVLIHAVENGRDLAEDLEELRQYHRAGVRLLSLVHSSTNNLADSAGDEAKWNGLSPLGARAIQQANDLGLWIDVSHASAAAIAAAAKLSRAPVIASHTAAGALVPDNPANLSDEAIRAVARNGGLVCVFFGSEGLVPGYLAKGKELKQEVVAELRDRKVDLASKEAEAYAEEAFRSRLPRADLDAVADHIEHVARLAGWEHVCIGSDFDGIGPSAAKGLDDVSRYQDLARVLRQRGASEKALRGMASANLLRVWRRVEAAR
jgi:membrane dipeptidase